ncbi:putative peptidase family C78 [Rosellinia necatrix]|uniref:Putative peptidase family C78 n=1 Tax=Rosellinia necatrix TaxID=77044 RepID=A0A1W2THP4_ROSNE|nr:putative peptidase family C78 [Rosellinia necatrix]
MSSQENTMACPLCGYKTDMEHAILFHVDEFHPEESSPLVADPDLGVSGVGENYITEWESGNDEDAGLFVECSVEGCLKQVSLAELDHHNYLHTIEWNGEAASDSTVASAEDQEYRSPYSRPDDVARSSRRHYRERAQSPEDHDSAVDAWKKIFGLSQPKKLKDSPNSPIDARTSRKRLGKSELGKHAYENQMPGSLITMLKKGKYKSAEGIIPALARLLEQNPLTEYAYLCHPAVQHISKLRNEGSFCGYRNIQMLSSYIVGARVEGAEKLRNRIPSIFRIQDYIENAWDMDINASGRIETGGIKGTRKYIGTSEAQAMFVSLKIPCEAEAIKFHEQGSAEAALFAYVRQYFESAPLESSEKVRCTTLPPIYFQHRGHSLTIVGLERLVSGSLKLLVFDPMLLDSWGVARLAERLRRHGDAKGGKAKVRSPIHQSSDNALRLYRRGHSYLRKYHEFELLKLNVDSIPNNDDKRQVDPS